MPTRSPCDIDTIGRLIEFNHRVALYCENYRGGLSCGFVKWLDLEKLAERLGSDHGCLHDDLVPHLWCTKCGGKRVSIRMHPPAAPWAN